MAHSHDHTLLARLGFADPDRKEPWHDIACQYLTQPPVMAKLAAMLPAKRVGAVEIAFCGDEVEECTLTANDFESAIGKLEVHIAKGYGYTVGFLDVMIETAYRQRSTVRTGRPKRRDGFNYLGRAQFNPKAWNWEGVSTKTNESDSIVKGQVLAIEVKAHQATAGDVLRQLALYREHFRAPGNEWREVVWLLATCYPITAREAEALAQAKVLHVQLSPERIMAWAAERDLEPYAAPEV